MEIYYNNNWATVCDDDWDQNDASVVCRQLGYGTESPLAYATAAFGKGTGLTLLDGVSCTSNESNIFDCRHNGFENHDCTHDEDAGVGCGNALNCKE